MTDTLSRIRMLTAIQGINPITMSWLRDRYPQWTERELFIWNYMLTYGERAKVLETGEMPERCGKQYMLDDLDILLGAK